MRRCTVGALKAIQSMANSCTYTDKRVITSNNIRDLQASGQICSEPTIATQAKNELNYSEASWHVAVISVHTAMSFRLCVTWNNTGWCM